MRRQGKAMAAWVVMSMFLRALELKAESLFKDELVDAALAFVEQSDED